MEEEKTNSLRETVVWDKTGKIFHQKTREMSVEEFWNRMAETFTKAKYTAETPSPATPPRVQYEPASRRSFSSGWDGLDNTLIRLLGTAFALVLLWKLVWL